MRRLSSIRLLALGICLPISAAFAGVIQVSIGPAVPFDNWPTLSGSFYTGGNTSCGIALDCNETTTFSLTDGGTGITISGTVTLTTTDSGGATTSALLDVTDLVIDNPGISGFEPVAITFLSDQFDPTPSQPIGMGYSGYMGSDLGPGNNVNALVQGGLHDQTGGFTGIFPGSLGFGPAPAVAANVPSPIDFAEVDSTGAISGVTQLIGTIAVNVNAPHSEVVVSNFVVETGDPAALVPEPGSLFLAGSALALGLAWRRKRQA